ncbi:MAG TPA: permease-like cell division protein FtsX [Candidatus Dojkabacteria bacterium]|nr:permease-like cell division protein FtsX [Candidatus Dojkabacteria bacterium]
MNRIAETTKKNIIRNRWLSITTILVIAIIFTLATIFSSIALIARNAVTYYEKRSQVIVFFKQETPESEIFKFRDAINDPTLVESIDYTSKEQALEIYKKDFENDPALVDTITADTLPPSLGIRAKSIQALEQVIKNINDEKAKNAYIDDVLYFKSVVDSIKTISNIMNYGALALIIGFVAVTFTLITVTISFNILSHKGEIEIMHLVGSTDKYIKTPFILEGAFYGFIGALISATVIIIPWYIIFYMTRNTDVNFWIVQSLNDLNLGFLKGFNIFFFLIFYAVQLILGVVLGGLSSYIAVVRYMNSQGK